MAISFNPLESCMLTCFDQRLESIGDGYQSKSGGNRPFDFLPIGFEFIGSENSLQLILMALVSLG